MKQTQCQMVISYLKEKGSITPMQAFHDLGITKLATRISELRKRGRKISGVMEESENRYGKTVRYMRYTLGE